MNEEEFIEICRDSKTMAEAARRLGMPFTTFSRKAKALGVYKTNQSGRGCPKKAKSPLTVDRLNNGEFPNYQSYKLKNWLLKNNLKENKCEICGISEWNGKQLNCQLHHKYGNPHNNCLENLMIICPNCHSQTENFTAKNKRRKTK